MSDPLNKVMAALPGTIHELVERTGYPQEFVRKALANLRAEGSPIRAVEDGSRSVGRAVDPEVRAGTVYTLATSSLTAVEREE